jgi:hypothetical protein
VQRRHAHAFDASRYELEFANNHVLKAYCALLKDYQLNTARVNHIAVSYMQRVRRCSSSRSRRTAASL